jgi:hypothetical protein
MTVVHFCVLESVESGRAKAKSSMVCGRTVVLKATMAKVILVMLNADATTVTS